MSSWWCISVNRRFSWTFFGSFCRDPKSNFSSSKSLSKIKKNKKPLVENASRNLLF
ncbi:hypothetical protein PGB90_008611 [Kerria lacca]